MAARKRSPYQASPMAIDFIRHDPAVCMTPGLFRSFKKGDRERAKLKVVHEYSEGKYLEFIGPDQLGVDDLRVLQGLVSLATRGREVLPAEPANERDKQVREDLALKWEACGQEALVIKGSYADLAREIGHADLNDTLPLRRSLERLWMVSVIVDEKKDSRRRGFRLIASYGSDGKGAHGQLHVGLNPQITEIILGRSPKHTRIDMGEVRALRSDAARLIHQRLCGWIDPGKSGKITLETLCGYVWPDEVNGDAVRQRRVRARKALQEIADLGWIVDEYEQGRYRILRPSRAGLLDRSRIADMPKAA